MTEPYLLWALLVGLAVGVVLTWFAIGRLPRRTDDVSPEERVVEASWISSELAARGKHVGQRAVEDVLELHETYLLGPAPNMTPEERAALAAELAQRAEPTAVARPADRTRASDKARPSFPARAAASETRQMNTGSGQPTASGPAARPTPTTTRQRRAER